ARDESLLRLSLVFALLALRQHRGSSDQLLLASLDLLRTDMGHSSSRRAQRLAQEARSTEPLRLLDRLDRIGPSLRSIRLPEDLDRIAADRRGRSSPRAGRPSIGAAPVPGPAHAALAKGSGRPMRVLHLSTTDVQGGAARGAFWLHKALQDQGVGSSMF